MPRNPRTATAKAESKTDLTWTVFDTNAYPTASNPTGHREHMTRDRTNYKLHHKDGCEMPMRHAVDFLKDPAFVVVDEDGNRVEPIVAGDTGAPQPKMRADQVVATLAELTDQALLVRARQVNPLATKQLGRQLLIQLLTEGELPSEAQAGPTDTVDGEADLIEDDDGE